MPAGKGEEVEARTRKTSVKKIQDGGPQSRRGSHRDIVEKFSTPCTRERSTDELEPRSSQSVIPDVIPQGAILIV
jgi:hypothetical protein